MENVPKPDQPTVRMNTFRRNRQTRAHKESSCWATTPGNTDLVTKVMWDLNTVAEMNGRVGLEVTHIRVANVEGETKVYMWPIDRNDPEALEIKQTGGKRRVNLGPFLEDCGLALPARTRERFRLVIVPNSATPANVPNALMFDLSAPLERQKLGEGKKGEKNEETEQKAKSEKAEKAKSEKTEKKQSPTQQGPATEA